MIKAVALGAFDFAANRRFATDERGTVAVIFALVALPLLSVLSLAIDYGRATHVQSTLQNATDAAAGAAIRLAGAETDTIRDSFAANFRANLPTDLKQTPFQLVVDKDKGTVQAKVETKVATSLIGIVGISSLDVVVETTQRFASTGGGSRDGSGSGSGSGGETPATPGTSAPASGVGSRKPDQKTSGQQLSGEAEQRLRQMGYNLDDPVLRQRAAEAEAKMRELIAKHPGLLRAR